jgi:hypothetical protein
MIGLYFVQNNGDNTQTEVSQTCEAKKKNKIDT